MKKLIAGAVSIGVLALAPATAGAQALEPSDCTPPGGPLTSAYHTVHLVPEPFLPAGPIAENYELIVHDTVECGILAPNDPTR